MNDYTNAIEISNLTKKFDGFTLNNLNMSVPKGSIMGFIGQIGVKYGNIFRSIFFNIIFFIFIIYYLFRDLPDFSFETFFGNVQNLLFVI